MAFLRLPEGTADIVRAGGGPLTVDAVEYGDDGIATGVLVSVVVFLDEGRLRSIAEADYLAEQARVDADREARRILKQQVVDALAPLTGQLASASLTLAQAQAFVKALVYLAGGIDPATGRYRAPGEWLR